eukprot:935527-Alexandrium_andersonii.AAC.1
MLRALWSGAIWTAKEAYKAGQVPRPVCPDCGAEEASLEHMLWECPIYEDLRQVCLTKLHGLRPADLPRSLALHGLAPLQLATCQGPLWHSSQIAPEQFDHALLEAVRPLDLSRLHVSVVGEVLRGPTPRVELHIPPACDLAPASPNVFSDGSVRYPRVLHWAFGGAGAWFPRDLAWVLRRDAEDTFTDFCWSDAQEGDVWVEMKGPVATSTRAELLAACLAFMAPVPINIAVDSQAVVKRVQAFLDNPPQVCTDMVQLQGCRTYALAQKFLTMRDGDLWQAMAILLQARGKGASAITKVKGHVTRAQLSKYGMDEST